MRTLPCLLLALLTISACAKDLVTRDGSVYKDYKVMGHDTGFITIMYADGGGKVPLSQLAPDLQKKYGYDPRAAAAAVQGANDAARRDREAALAMRKKAGIRPPSSPSPRRLGLRLRPW